MKEINTDLIVKQINKALVEVDKKLEILKKAKKGEKENEKK